MNYLDHIPDMPIKPIHLFIHSLTCWPSVMCPFALDVREDDDVGIHPICNS